MIVCELDGFIFVGLSATMMAMSPVAINEDLIEIAMALIMKIKSEKGVM